MLLRLITWTTAALSLVWVFFALPDTFRVSKSGLESISSKVLGGETYAPEALQEIRRRLEALDTSGCSERILQIDLILRQRLAETALEGTDAQEITRAVSKLEEAGKHLVACAPYNSFGWLTLFWADVVATKGVDPNYDYLRLSYATGPREGWIARRRSMVMMPIYDQLPPDLKDIAGKELANLVTRGYRSEGLDILSNAPDDAGVRVLELVEFIEAERAARRADAELEPDADDEGEEDSGEPEEDAAPDESAPDESDAGPETMEGGVPPITQTPAEGGAEPAPATAP